MDSNHVTFAYTRLWLAARRPFRRVRVLGASRGLCTLLRSRLPGVRKSARYDWECLTRTRQRGRKGVFARKYRQNNLGIDHCVTIHFMKVSVYSCFAGTRYLWKRRESDASGSAGIQKPRGQAGGPWMVFAWRGPCAACCLPFVRWFRHDQQPCRFFARTISFPAWSGGIICPYQKTIVFDRGKPQIVIEEMTRKGASKQIIPFQEIAGSLMGYFGKPSNCANFHFTRLRFRSGEQYILFAPGRFYDGCSNRQIMEARKEQLELWIEEGEIH